VEVPVSTVRRVVTVALVAASLALWSAGPASASIPTGPGPQHTYTVHPQPAAGSCHYRWTSVKQPLPDTHCTPGATNPKVTQKTLATTICKSGYTTAIRPPSSITGKEKVANAKSYHYIGSLAYAEYDHLIALELGGDPNDRRNLWVEPPSPGHTARQGVSNPKDSVENYLKSQVCNAVHLASHHQGTARTYLPLAAAEQLIASNWTTAKTLASRHLVRG
jgi:hypothetical protein